MIEEFINILCDGNVINSEKHKILIVMQKDAITYDLYIVFERTHRITIRLSFIGKNIHELYRYFLSSEQCLSAHKRISCGLCDYGVLLSDFEIMDIIDLLIDVIDFESDKNIKCDISDNKNMTYEEVSELAYIITMFCNQIVNMQIILPLNYDFGANNSLLIFFNIIIEEIMYNHFSVRITSLYNNMMIISENIKRIFNLSILDKSIEIAVSLQEIKESDIFGNCKMVISSFSHSTHKHKQKSLVYVI